ncbi:MULTISPECIES: hypothetical protein [Chryseobacterium]|uniref:hypothetical protein n=1 Tax=Chryseobacterium TaxID=59732 RepID=UPI0016274B4B|nr:MULTISPECIES: hypothetical protein [Chryseobacterium]MBF6643934.1 hypothetical protein [Chryseobacterium indologenes]MBU3046800.1 hypothetical protein [Chryseobacterium indologenes]QQQ72339.1 hypothetical protein JHW31_06340 [Chryseobacterium indologenes]
METLIIIGLMVIILLILTKRYKITIKRKDTELKQLPNKQQENVMGTAKFSNHQSVRSDIEDLQTKQSEALITVSDPLIPTIVDEALQKDDHNDDSSWTEEEEELKRYGMSTTDNSLAQGVTFEELGATDAFLRNDNIEINHNETAAKVLHQLQGTDLFNLLKNSSKGAAQKISMLMDKVFKQESQITAEVQKNSWDDFDIEEFI